MLRSSAFFIVQFSHPYMTTWKTIALTRQTFVGKVMSLLFNKLSSFSSKEQASFNFMAAITICSDFRAQENKICYCFHFSLFYLPWNDGAECHDLSFLIFSFKPAFSPSSFTFIKRFFTSSSLSAIRVVSSAYLWLLIFLSAILIPVCDSSSLAFHRMYSA